MVRVPVLLTVFSLLSVCLAHGQTDEIPVPTPRPEQDATQPATSLPDDPPRIYQAACPALRSGLVTGRMDAPILEGDCVQHSPIAISALGGVKLSREARLNCSMAIALGELASIADLHARSFLESGLTAIDAGPGFQCRRRNRNPDGKISEHAFANAIDIIGFELADGRKITVGKHWPVAEDPATDEDEIGEPGTDEGEEKNDETAPSAEVEETPRAETLFLEQVHREACKLFTTVLGPDANQAHRSHFHFDLGCHGRDCRYFICE